MNKPLPVITAFPSTGGSDPSKGRSIKISGRAIIRRSSYLEVIVAKGQKRSGREAKKPKKAASKKPSGSSVASVFEQAPGATTKQNSKKT
jgi:hypothetical protein